MNTRNLRAAAACALLATTSLTLPAVARAATPAPKFVDTVDDHGVDLVTGLPFFTMEEGGIGAGPGRVAMQRIWSEGAGWADNWTGGLYQVTSGGTTTKYVQFAGISDTFTLSGSNWISAKADGASLSVDAQGYWNYTARDGTAIKFNIANTDEGNGINSAMNCPGADPTSCQVPLSITRPDGLKFTLTWLTGIICVPVGGDPCGSSLTYQRLASVASSAGYTVNFTYPTGASTGSAQWYQRVSATFNNSANPPSPQPGIAYAYPSSTEVDVTDPAGRVWKFTMDTSGRIAGIQRPGSTSNNVSYGYGTDGTVNTSTKDGVTNTYGRAGVIETVTNPLTQQRVVNADATGRPASDKDGLNRTTSYQYDANGRLTRITAPEGNYAQYAYDARGNVTTQTSVPKAGSGLSNIVSSASYDATCSNIVKCNEPNSTTDAKGNVTDYTYDPTHGGLLTATQPAPAVGGIRPQTRYSYTQITSASGDLVYMLTKVAACQTLASCTNGADETQVVASYNSNLLPTSVTRQNGTATLVSTNTLTYNPRGTIDTVDGPLTGSADTIKYRYDNADQLIGVTSPDPDGAGAGNPNRAIRLTYRSDGQVSKQELGTVASQSDADWALFAALQTIDITFDTNSRPTQQKLSAGGTSYALTQTSYDALGRLNCTAARMDPLQWDSQSDACTPQTTGPDGPDRISQDIYDAASEVTQVKVGVGITGDAATERTLTYNANGTLATLKDAENNLTTYVYDGFDRAKEMDYPSPTKGSGTSNAADHEQLTYDANSNVTLVTLRDAHAISFTYDHLDRPITKSSNQLCDSAYTYDLLGRQLTAGFITCGETVTNTFDALGRLTSSSSNAGGTAHALTYQYDLAGRRTRVTWWDGFFVDYDRLVTGEVSKVRENGAVSGVGVLATYAYDNLGNRTSLTFGNGASQAFTYDAVSRLASLTNDLSGTTNDLAATIAYNPASQVKSAVRAGDAYAFTGLTSGTTNSTANGLNQQITIGGATATWDTLGNLTADPTSGNSYTYDVEDKLKTAVAGGATRTLSYDPLNRLDRYNPGTATRFVYDGAEAAAELDTSGAVQHRYVMGDGADEVLVDYAGSGTSSRRFLSTDERGSVVSLTDSSGALIGIDTYDEYGKPGATNTGRFQYTGQRWLSEIGAYDYKARVYMPHLGIFAQTDPIGQQADPNLYAYVGGDPVNFVDPLGLTGTAPPPVVEPNPMIITGRRRTTQSICDDDPSLCGRSGPTSPPSVGIRNPNPITITGTRRPQPGHRYVTTQLLCSPNASQSCHIERANTEACVLPGHISTAPIKSNRIYAVYGSYADIWPAGFVRTTQTGQFSFRNTTTWLHPLSGTIDRLFFQNSAGDIFVTTVGQGTAATALQDKINKERGPGIFQQQNEICAAIIGGNR